MKSARGAGEAVSERLTGTESFPYLMSGRRQVSYIQKMNRQK